jgi:putative drug exporter of the RND superfamily
VLVPAVMVRLGRANWWFPEWLGRILPRIGIEGEDFLKERSAPAPAGGSKPAS